MHLLHLYRSGKKGVDMSGMTDLGGVKFFNLAVDTPEGDLALLDAVLEGASLLLLCCGCVLSGARERARVCCVLRTRRWRRQRARRARRLKTLPPFSANPTNHKKTKTKKA